jgi:hypothetical protein
MKGQTMTRRRNEDGRFSTGYDWYRQIEEDNIRRIEAERAAQEEAAYLAPLLAAMERPDDDEYYEESDGDLVPWDRAA